MTEYQKLFKAGACLKRISALPHYVRATATRVGLVYEPDAYVERNAKELRSILTRKEETKC